MKIRCPHCKKVIDLKTVRAGAEIEKISIILNSLAGAALMVSEYVDLFQSGASMTPKKRLRLLSEIKTLIDTGEFSLDRRQYKVSGMTVVEGIRSVVNRSLSGLTSHRYLFRVLAGMADTKKDEVQRVKEKRSPSPPPSPPGGEGTRAEDTETKAERNLLFQTIRGLGEKLKMDR